MTVGRIIPEFTTGLGPSEPRNQPEKLHFPSKTSDGSARVVKNEDVAYFQASTGTREGIAVPFNRPILNLQVNRVYSPSRRVIPRAY